MNVVSMQRYIKYDLGATYANALPVKTRRPGEGAFMHKPYTVNGLS